MHMPLVIMAQVRASRDRMEATSSIGEEPLIRIQIRVIREKGDLKIK